ncbi:hypothetical protein [Rossellomorea marisflavi]
MTRIGENACISHQRFYSYHAGCKGSQEKLLIIRMSYNGSYL